MSVSGLSAIGRLRLCYPVLGSTNEQARHVLAADFPSGTTVIADYQIAGRGRQGRRWQAAPGTALLLSIGLRLDWPAVGAPRLTMAAAVATAAAIGQITGQPALIKWPNDILLTEQWRKTAGILVETNLQGGRLVQAVLGIGINVSDHPADQAGATNLEIVADRPIDRWQVLEALLAEVSVAVDQAEHAPERLLDAWRARLVTLGQIVTVNQVDARLVGLAEAVDEDGALLVRTADGSCHRVTAAEVSLTHPR